MGADVTGPWLGPEKELVRRAAQGGAPSCSVRAAGGTWTLQLCGALPGAWCGHLAIHCSGAQLSIEQGDARRLGTGRWIGTFLLRPPSDELRPEAFDFVRMALRRPLLVLDPSALPLRRVRVEPPRSAGQPALLSLEADDELGLLARILGCCESAGLRPSRLWLRTRDGTASDRLWLHTLGGGSPEARQLAHLRELLVELAAG